MACQAMSNYAFGAWTPTFFERLHHWPRSQSGLALGLMTMICGCIGLFAGGRLSDRWIRAGMNEAPLRVGLIGLLGVAVTLVPAMLSPSGGVTVALLVPAVFFLALPIGCSFASIQMIFPNEVRGTVSAIVLMVLNLLGLTLGTLLPGLLDDHLFHDEQMLASPSRLPRRWLRLPVLATLPTIAPYRRDFGAQHAQPPRR
jgi:MFS family permease